MAAKLRKNYFMAKVEQLYTSDSHNWWRKVKHIIKGKDSNPFANLDCQGSPYEIAEAINNFFVGVSAHLPEVNPSILAKLTDDYSNRFIVFPEEVERRLANINIHKAPGPDGLPSWFLRDFAPYICQPLAAIFNASIREGFVPPIWKAAEVVPVPKKSRPRHISTDLRPISLLPCMAKIFESIIGEWLLSVLEPSFDPNQFGCRRQRSTTHALTAILHAWKTTLDQGGAVRTLLVDYKKAFDCVNHNILLQKLYAKNIPHCLIKWFCSYLQHRSQRVRFGAARSGWLQLSGAMPQGSWLGPLAFLVLIDDLEVDCTIHKYVDDTTLSELTFTSLESSHMQYFFQQLLDWADSNDMIVNYDKTKEMVIGPPSLTSNISPLITPSGHIERVSSVKLLGIHLDANFSWTTHVEAVLSKATQRLYFLKQLKRAGLPDHQLRHFYLAVIRSVLEYAAPVWHHSLTKAQTDQLEAIQKRAIRIMCPFTKGMPYTNALFVTDLTALAIRRDQLSRRFFNSIVEPTSCLHSLLPPERDNAIVSRLRARSKYPRLLCRTRKYQPFISYALSNYQT